MKRKKNVNLIVLSMISTMILIGCGGGNSSNETESNTNKAPIVNAGMDITTNVNKSITIVGVATDEDGSISSYEWKKGQEVLGTEATLTYIPTKIGTDILTLTVMDDDGAVASDSVNIIVKEETNTLPSTNLPTVSKDTIFTKNTQEATRIKNSSHNLTWAYYMDNKSKRWYISPVDATRKIDVYSLMPFKNGRNGWGTVGTNVASFNLQNETVKIGNIADNPTHKYYDVGWQEDNVDVQIQKDIEYIRNSTVSIKWWFFYDSSLQSWYIINKDTNVYRFSSKTVNGKRNYDWIKVDMGSDNAVFYISNNTKNVKFNVTTNETNTPYPAPVFDSKYYKSSNAFYVSNSNLKGECTWYSYGRIAELYNKKLISKKAYELVYNGLWGNTNRHAKNWSYKMGIQGQGFSTNKKVLPLNKRKRGLLAIWECGTYGHVGFVEEIGGANKEWYILSDSNRFGKHKYKRQKYKFDSNANIAGAIDDYMRVKGGACYPTFYDLDK